MVPDRYWLSLDGVDRNRTATMLIVQAPVGWRQSLARLCWGLGKRAWVYFVHYIHLVRTDFDLLDECTNDPTPGRHVAGIQPSRARLANSSIWPIRM